MSNLVPNQTEAKSWFIVNNGLKELRLKVICKNKNKEIKRWNRCGSFILHQQTKYAIYKSSKRGNIVATALTG